MVCFRVFAAARNITAEKNEKLIIAKKELLFQFKEKRKRTKELFIARASRRIRSFKISFLGNMSQEIYAATNGILVFSKLLKGSNLIGETQ